MIVQITNDIEVTNAYFTKNPISYQNENLGTRTLDGAEAAFTVVATKTFQITTVSSSSKQDVPFDKGVKLKPTTFEAEVFSTLTNNVETTTTTVTEVFTTTSNAKTTTTVSQAITSTTKITPKTCSDVTWNPRSEICCNGYIQSTYGMLIPKFCNSLAYDATASICYKGTLFSAVGYLSPGCCGGNIYDYSKFICCQQFPL